MSSEDEKPIKKFQKLADDKDAVKPKKDDEYEFEDFSWFKATAKIQERREPDTYIAYYNDIRRPIEPGEQLYYFYGERSNLFLLMNYGFAIEDNKYDSFEFHLNRDLKYIKDMDF